MYACRMPKVSVSFRCPEELVKALDDDAKDDHRDRSNLIVKIITLYYDHKNGKKPTAKKKAGASK